MIKNRIVAKTVLTGHFCLNDSLQRSLYVHLNGAARMLATSQELRELGFGNESWRDQKGEMTHKRCSPFRIRHSCELSE